MTTKQLDSFTDNELNAQVESHLLEYRKCRVASKHPRAFLLGGQSGAGKTLLHHILSQQMSPMPTVINGDDFRKLHPRYELLKDKYGDDWVEHCSAWSGQMTEALIDKLSRLGYNLIIEGTLRTSEVPLRTATLLRERGYAVSLALMAVKPDISLTSCQIHYEEMRIAGTTPRATDPAHHAKIVHDIVGNLATLEESGLFDEIHLYTRAGEQVFPVEGAKASEVLHARIFGPWTAEERGHHAHLKRKLAQLAST